MKTVVGVFRNLMDAQMAMRDLEREGIATNDISVIVSNEGGKYDHYSGGAASAAEDK